MIFQFQLYGENLNSNQWAYDNGLIEGDFQIYVDGQVFVDEPSVNVIELVVQLGKWYDALQANVLRNFVYDSIDCDESMLTFYIQGDDVQVRSSIAKFELQPLPLVTVKNAVLRFITVLNEKLIEMNYSSKIECFITDDISENQKAIFLLEQNEYAESLALFKKLAEEKPSVQSLHNLAWIYLREEEDMDTANLLLTRVLELQPKSPFPYMVLGEITLHQGKFEQAKGYLQEALDYEFSEEATYNLAMAHFQLGEYELSATTFSRCEGDSGQTQLHEVVAWMYAGKVDRAKSLLDRWNEEAYDYTGAIEIADVYVELGCFADAQDHFQKEWNSYIHSPYIVGRFAYTLLKLGDVEACEVLIQNAVHQTIIVITDVQQEELDEHWTAEDRAERIQELTVQKKVFDTLLNRLQNGYVPTFEYDMYPMGGCQLFGCMQHGHAEYGGE